jgi:tRNA-specific 2-thiouridylase
MKIAVGISGGVDSAVAAMLLKNQGHELLGVTMTLGREGEEKSVAEAREVASRLGLELKVFDFSREWKKNVVDYIRETYLAGATPNPCVRCNETVKLSLLPEAAFSAGCDFFATGHYARVENARIFRAADKFKDQSYFLCRVRRQVLEKLILPLGAYTKDEVRAMAKDFGFAAAGRADSQDFCGGDAVAMVGAEDREGNIVDTSGKVLGRHRGFWHYTIGKRKGLGIGGGTPYYVVALDASRNEVVVAFKDVAQVTEFEIGSLVEFPCGLEGALSVKVRSAGEPKGPVKVEKLGDGRARVCCEEGIVGVAPGQSAVFYRNDEVAGGGIIRQTRM